MKKELDRRAFLKQAGNSALGATLFTLSSSTLDGRQDARQPRKGPAEAKVSVRGKKWGVEIDPSTLSAEVRLADGTTFPVSTGLRNLGPAINLVFKRDAAMWELPALGLQVATSIRSGRFFIEMLSDKAQEFTWPLVAPTDDMRAVILPHGEGFYFPVRDKRCQAFVTDKSPMNTMEELSMPLWGIDYGSQSLTYILTNPIDNSLSFERKGDGLALGLTHHFQRNYAAKRYGLMIVPGGSSPIEPSLVFRKWLIDTGQFISLREKLERLPDLERLFGAAQIYLWADGVLDASDVRQWPALVSNLRKPTSAAAKRIAALLPADTRQALMQSAAEKFPSKYAKLQVISGLNAVIRKPELYQQDLWPLESLPAEVRQIASEGAFPNSPEKMAKLNSCLLSGTFRDMLTDGLSFGGGVSPKMIHHLQEAGFDRLWLGVAGLETVRCLPQTVPVAEKAGYLFGPYDSYHSIHPPGAKDTWPTAQFGEKLWEAGAIIKANGQRDRGFKGVGSHLSSIAAEPYLEKRVNEEMEQFGFNSIFIDCDAAGELFDNYSTTYPATKQLDMELRVNRLAWISHTFHAVLGSEMGDFYAAPVIDFGQGIMTPVFGWGDPLLHDAKSPYFLGRYYPPGRPEVFFKPTVLPDKYKDIYFSLRYRVPLYQAAFHDSVITTHHWSNPSLKFTNVLAVNELLELLYGVPPLYHLDLGELEKRKQEIQTHCNFFSPHYRKLVFSPLSEFEWLTEDHLIQKVKFGTQAWVIANFSGVAYEYKEQTVPPNSVCLIWQKTGQMAIYTSQYPRT